MKTKGVTLFGKFLSRFALLQVSACLSLAFVFGILSIRKGWGQEGREYADLEQEFWSEAPKGWKAVRVRATTDQAVYVKITNKRTKPGGELLHEEIVQTVLATPKLRLFEKDLKITGRIHLQQVWASNSQYAFGLSRRDDSAWRITGTDLLESPITSFVDEDLILNHAPATPPREVLRVLFRQDVRLQFASDNTSIGDRLAVFQKGEYETFHKKTGLVVENFEIENFTETFDEKIGRVVSVNVKGSSKSDRGDSKTKGVFDFLPDKDWVLFGYRTTYTGEKPDGSAYPATQHNLVTAYDSPGDKFPSRIIRKTLRDDNIYELNDYEIRSLSSSELEEAKKKCYLTKHGFPEPTDVSTSRPKEIKWLGFLGTFLALVACFFVYRFWPKRKSEL